MRGQMASGDGARGGECTREGRSKGRARRGEEDVGECRRAGFGRGTPVKCLLESSILDAQSIISAVGGFSIKHAVTHAEHGVLGELPCDAKPRSKIIFIDVQRRSVK